MTTNAIIEIGLFISHTGEDKESFVAPLARYLNNMGYDEFSLSSGIASRV